MTITSKLAWATKQVMEIKIIMSIVTQLHDCEDVAVADDD